MIHVSNKAFHAVVFSLVCLALVMPGNLFADRNADQILKSLGRESGVFAVIGCGDKHAPELAAALGENGNSLVHAVAGDAKELAAFNKAIAETGVKGAVSAEQLKIANLPYRPYLINVLVIMNPETAAAAGLTLDKARAFVAPYGRLVTCAKGKVKNIEEIPVPAEMDVWSHKYHSADGIPQSHDKVFDLPAGFRWNAGLPMNFDNTERSANRYSSTRALILDDGRCFTFNECVYDNLGDTWKSSYGTNQYLTCRDAFNGRLLWRKDVGDMYYGGLYIENLAPVVSTGTKLYLPTSEGKMQALDTKTGTVVREMDTKFIPGVIAAEGGIVIAATWKDGKRVGSVKRYDRRRMDWGVGEGSVEAYDDKTGKLLWKHDLLGISMVIADGRVYIANRSAPDPIEENHNRKLMKKEKKGEEEIETEVKRPQQKVIAFDLKSGKILWEALDADFRGVNNQISIEAAGDGAVAVARAGKGSVVLLSGETGKILDPDAAKTVEAKFFRYRQHVCTPIFKVEDISLGNRGGHLAKPGDDATFMGARAACLTGTVPAYGSGYIAQNWCNCSPGQIPGLIAIGPNGRNPKPEEMEAVPALVSAGKYSKKDATPDSAWSSFRGNAERSSSAACDVSKEAKIVWTEKVADSETREGMLKRDWQAYLNARLTAPVISGDLAIIGDIDHNEVIAVSLKDGSVVWRHMLAGRMDTAPTLYKGICLAADHTGHVTAIKIKNGELIYRLRVAPDDKRMISYGKVESVWPVIGGVMLHDGVAHATAGRTQGSDGGLIVRSFKPETGKQVWARAIPARGEKVFSKKPMRNDALIRFGDNALLMGHHIELKSGELIKDPEEEFKEKAQAVREKELGRKLNRKEQHELWRELIPELKKLTGDVVKIKSGNEGIYSWNWTRVGHRKFNSLNAGGLAGDTVAWSDDYRASCDRKNKVSYRYVGKDALAGIPRHKNYVIAADRQVSSLVLCNNMLLVGGAIVDKDEKGGFVTAYALDSDEPVWEQIFDAKLAFNGLAVDAGKVVASLDDGTVACIE